MPSGIRWGLGCGVCAMGRPNSIHPRPVPLSLCRRALLPGRLIGLVGRTGQIRTLWCADDEHAASIFFLPFFFQAQALAQARYGAGMGTNILYYVSRFVDPLLPQVPIELQPSELQLPQGSSQQRVPSPSSFSPRRTQPSRSTPLPTRTPSNGYHSRNLSRCRVRAESLQCPA